MFQSSRTKAVLVLYCVREELIFIEYLFLLGLAAIFTGWSLMPINSISVFTNTGNWLLVDRAANVTAAAFSLHATGKIFSNYYLLRSPCFAWIVSPSQWVVFRLVHSEPIELVLYGSIVAQSKSDEGENTKWSTGSKLRSVDLGSLVQLNA